MEGRFAMIDEGLGFCLVPWTPTLERQVGRQVTGVATALGVDWSVGRKRGMELVKLQLNRRALA